MVREYQRRNNVLDPEKLLLALNAVKDGVSVRSAAKSQGINRETLRLYWKVRGGELEDTKLLKTAKPGRSSAFNEAQEAALEKYLLDCSDSYFGLTINNVRKLAFDFAHQLKISTPSSWDGKKIAGIDWFYNFRKRHPNLSLRKPEATSLQRAMGFNKTIVNKFFTQLRSLYARHSFDASHIYNMDETGVTTVQDPGKIICRRGVKQIGRITSSERGTLITVALAVNAAGNSIPPFFIFPRVKYHEHFINGAPPGSIGTANPSGWMNADHFLQFLQHFKMHSGASMTNPVLLVLDNHQSHLSIAGLKFCVDNGINVLSIPPHSSHKLQPLDRSVYGPFKRAMAAHMDSWINAHPGRSLSIYDLPGIVSLAMDAAVTRANNISGFKATGIWPFNHLIFNDEEFKPSMVTDIPQISVACNSSQASNITEELVDTRFASDNEKKNFDDLLESIRPLPKAEPRSTSRHGRKKRSSEILTDSEMMSQLAAEQKSAKKQKTEKEAAKERPKKRGRPPKKT